MAFESIADKLEQVDQMLAAGKSLRAIAREVGVGKSTIAKYKAQHFDLKAEVKEAWQTERAKNHDERLAEGKARLVDNLELLNLIKIRAEELLSINAGDIVPRAVDLEEDPEKPRPDYRYTHTGLVALWKEGAKMAVDAVRQEQEITGEDPLGRLADGMGNWLDVANAAAEVLSKGPPPDGE